MYLDLLLLCANYLRVDYSAIKKLLYCPELECCCVRISSTWSVKFEVEFREDFRAISICHCVYFSAVIIA